MKKLLLALLLLSLLLAACDIAPESPAAPSAAPTPALTPAPTPAPTPEPTPSPDVMLQGQALPWDTGELTLDSAEGLAEALPLLPKLRRVDLSAGQLDTEQMELLSALRPEVDFVFTVRFGAWTVRSDITCFSTLQGDGSLRYTSEELYPLLRFCRHLRALDLGHNDLTDISLIGQMPQLQVLILADNPHLTDISPLGELTELRYIELFMCWDIEDFSCLYSLTKLQDLNMAYCRNLADVSFIDNMPDFRNGWFMRTGVTREMLEPYREARPEITFVYGYPPDISSVAYGWRATERNAAIRRAFTNWRNVTDWRSWDDVAYHTKTQ